MNRQWFDGVVSWVCDLRFGDIPLDVVEEAKNQIVSIISAVHYGYGSEDAQAIALRYGVDGMDIAQIVSLSPKKAASYLSTLSMVYDYDDVMLGGHTSHSSVIVPLILAMNSPEVSGQHIITAVVAANEVAARFNIACALGQTRGQMASQLHLVSSAVARAKSECGEKHALAQSLLWCLVAPSKQFLPSFLSSHAKYFCAANALREGWEAYDFCVAGLKSSTDTLFGSGGFFPLNAKGCDLSLIDNLGSEWFTLTNSYKIYPACGYICSALDSARHLLSQHNIASDDIVQVELKTNIFALGVERLTQPYLEPTKTSLIPTLTFSPSFILASCLTHGDYTVSNLTEDKVRDPSVWNLRNKVKVEHVRRYSNRALFCGIPVGFVLGRAGLGKVCSFVYKLCSLVFRSEGRITSLLESFFFLVYSMRVSLTDFARIEGLKKELPSEVVIKMKSGKRYRSETIVPKGFAGNSTISEKREMLLNKYVGSLGDSLDGELVKRKISIVENFQCASQEDLKFILRFN